jgi:hypothetical protein
MYAVQSLNELTSHGENCMEWQGDVGVSFQRAVAERLAPPEPPLGWLAALPKQWQTPARKSATDVWDKTSALRNDVLRAASVRSQHVQVSQESQVRRFRNCIL